MDVTAFHEGFRKHFGAAAGHPGRFMDRLATAIRKEARLDVIAFDDWLHSRHGDYEDKGQSMAHCIAEHYGQEASDFCRSLL